MKYNNIIFDFDGTLSDTYPCFADAFVDTCGFYGIECDSRKAYDLLKVSVGNAIQSFDFKVPYREVSDKFHYFHELRAYREQKPYPEAGPLLEFIKAHGGKNFIFSHSGDIVKKLIGIWGWDELFDGIIDATVKLPRKPAPDGVNLICSMYGLDKAETIIVGDRDIDTDSGKNAGIDGCLFDPDGYYADVDVTYMVDSLKKVEDILLSE